MKITIVLLIAAVIMGCQSRTETSKPANKEQKTHSHDHGDVKGEHSHGVHASKNEVHSGLSLSISPTEFEVGKPTQLKLMVHDENNKMMSEFEPTHEKLIHFILIDKGMATFAHLHPDVSNDGTMTVTHRFHSGGTYYVYADVKPKGGSSATIRSQVVVKGDAAPSASLENSVPGVVNGEGWRANVSISSTKVGEATALFEFTKDGKAISDLEPYLGAMGHLVVVNTKDGAYVHAHPDENQVPGKVSFKVHFAKPGVYKGWGQFKRSNNVFDVPFVVHVN